MKTWFVAYGVECATHKAMLAACRCRGVPDTTYHLHVDDVPWWANPAADVLSIVTHALPPIPIPFADRIHAATEDGERYSVAAWYGGNLRSFAIGVTYPLLSWLVNQHKIRQSVRITRGLAIALDGQAAVEAMERRHEEDYAS